MFATQSAPCTYTGPPIFRPDTEDIGVLHARQMYRDTLAARLKELESLEFVFTEDGDLRCLNPPD